jgi:hypothetical protein
MSFYLNTHASQIVGLFVSMQVDVGRLGRYGQKVIVTELGRYLYRFRVLFARAVRAIAYSTSVDFFL